MGASEKGSVLQLDQGGFRKLTMRKAVVCPLERTVEGTDVREEQRPAGLATFGEEQLLYCVLIS